MHRQFTRPPRGRTASPCRADARTNHSVRRSETLRPSRHDGPAAHDESSAPRLAARFTRAVSCQSKFKRLSALSSSPGSALAQPSLSLSLLDVLAGPRAAHFRSSSSQGLVCQASPNARGHHVMAALAGPLAAHFRSSSSQGLVLSGFTRCAGSPRDGRPRRASCSAFPLVFLARSSPRILASTLPKPFPRPPAQRAPSAHAAHLPALSPHRN